MYPGSESESITYQRIRSSRRRECRLVFPGFEAGVSGGAVLVKGKVILAVDDEPKILEMVRSYLINEGFKVLTAASGPEAIEIVDREHPDLIVLDLMMPGMTGFDVFHEVKRRGSTPVIMLTAKADEVDKLVGLEMGADDYLTKPFSLRELAARIRAVLRRTHPEAGNGQDVLTFGDLSIDLVKYEVRVGGELITLTPTEYKLLTTMARNPNRVFTRLQLLDAALGTAYEGYERSIDTHISNLRRKLERDASGSKYIVTVFGLGYRFNASGERDRP